MCLPALEHGVTVAIGLAVGFFPGLRDLQQSTSLGFECRSGLLGGGGSTLNAMALPGAAAPMETV